MTAPDDVILFHQACSLPYDYVIWKAENGQKPLTSDRVSSLMDIIREVIVSNYIVIFNIKIPRESLNDVKKIYWKD